MCIHRESAHMLRDSVRLLASLGVKSLKCGAMMEQGEWASPEVAGLQLTKEEELEMFETVEKLEASGAEILRTDLQGEIRFVSDGKVLSISTGGEAAEGE